MSVDRKAWFLWVERFDRQPEPQIAFDFIPASLAKLKLAEHRLTVEDAGRTVDELAAKFPAPEVAP